MMLAVLAGCATSQNSCSEKRVVKISEKNEIYVAGDALTLDELKRASDMWIETCRRAKAVVVADPESSSLLLFDTVEALRNSGFMDVLVTTIDQ